MISRAICRGVVNSLKGFGRRFTARGSIRPGRWPTRFFAASPRIVFTDSSFDASMKPQVLTMITSAACGRATSACEPSPSTRVMRSLSATFFAQPRVTM